MNKLTYPIYPLGVSQWVLLRKLSEPVILAEPGNKVSPATSDLLNRVQMVLIPKGDIFTILIREGQSEAFKGVSIKKEELINTLATNTRVKSAYRTLLNAVSSVGDIDRYADLESAFKANGIKMISPRHVR